MLGGSADSNEKAILNIRKMGCQCFGYSPTLAPYPFDHKLNDIILTHIAETKPEIVLVCFGAIKQEYWIQDNLSYLKKLGITHIYGAGGTVDFISGKIQRAPKILQLIGLEGIYRFIQEPNLFRFKRLLLSLKVFKYIFIKS
ncbi:WecB/TagA/CpsF family glycosyltransferase [Providencia rettgeri]